VDESPITCNTALMKAAPTVRRLCLLLFALVLMATACSSSDGVGTPTQKAGGSDSAAAPDSSEGTASASESSESDDADSEIPPNTVPGYDARICPTFTKCPQEIQPDIWRGLHEGGLDWMVSPGGSVLVSVDFGQIRQWDVDDVLNGETVIVNVPTDYSTDPFLGTFKALLSDGKVVVMLGQSIGESPLGVFDLQASNPSEPVAVLDAKANHFVGLADGRLGVSTDQGMEIWDVSAPDGPVESIDMEVIDGFNRGPQYVGATDDGGVYFGGIGDVWTWNPPGSLVQRSDLKGFGRLDQSVLLSNGSAAFLTSNGPAVVIDLETGEGTLLDVPGVIDFRNDLQRIGELADGRVIARSNEEVLYAWDLDAPDQPVVLFGPEGYEPTAEGAEFWSLNAFTGLDDGRLVLSYAVRDAENADFGFLGYEATEIRQPVAVDG